MQISNASSPSLSKLGLGLAEASFPEDQRILRPQHNWRAGGLNYSARSSTGRGSMSSGNTPTREINWRILGNGEKTEGEALIVLYANRAAYVRRIDILFGQNNGPACT